jgi:hypothetical protein
MGNLTLAADSFWRPLNSKVRPRTEPQANGVKSCNQHFAAQGGRTLADVLLLDGTNVNHTLVEDGWCWWYRKYAPGDTVLDGLEKDAGSP